MSSARRWRPSDANKRPKQPCRYFLKGNCRFGEKCRFSHETSSTDDQPQPKHFNKPPARQNPELSTWRSLLEKNHYDELSISDMTKFFDLCTFLVDDAEQDTETIQKTISLLSEDDGLDVIKRMIDHYIIRNHTAPDCQRKHIWMNQVRPFLKILSSPTVSNSSVLEQYRAAILNFTVGFNGQRFQKLFQFVLAMLDLKQTDHTDLATRHSDIEMALAVFSMLIDSCTSNIVNDKFPPIVLNLREILEQDGDNEAFSLLQARKYLEYAQRRLGVGEALPSIENRAAQDSVALASFVLPKDLPGVLSRHGQRHDNDHTSIAKIQILPTSDEILSARSEYWPTTKLNQSHVPGTQWLADRNFRLLREDTVGQLRDVARTQLELMGVGGASDNTRNQVKIYKYDHARLESLSFDQFGGLRLNVSFRQPSGAPIEAERRREWWQGSRRLQAGALVCILNTHRSVAFCQVIDISHYPKDKNTEDVPRSSLPNLWANDDLANVSLKFVDTTQESLEWAAAWSRSRSYHAIVEFPGVLLPAFQPTLEALQKIAQVPNLPLSDLLVPVNTAGRVREVHPPQYAQKPGFRFNLKCLTNKNDEDFWYSVNDSPNPEALARVSMLDPTQALALLNSLRRCLALTEGPPGTGKSFTGAALIRVLITNKHEANLGPILCVTYTNHALDQVLEHLNEDGIERIIRIGSQSKSETLQNVNLNIVSKEMERTKFEKSILWRAFETTKSAAEQAQQPMAMMDRARSVGAIKAFLEVAYPFHHASLFPETDDEGFKLVGSDPKGALRIWLNGGSHLSTRRPLEEIENLRLSQLSQHERRALYESWIENIQRRHLHKILRISNEWEESKHDQDKVHREIKARCLEQADVIGVTTSGLARNIDLLKQARPKVLICEEAGEVLEAHNLTAFLPTIQHAILCGDHLQLRPQISNYELQGTHDRGKQYSLDVSLFERLVSPFGEDEGPIPYTILQTQRRMHPLISELIRPVLYPNLEDHEGVKDYPEVEGVRRRLFWMNHSHHERKKNESSGMDTSCSNPFEVDMTLALVSHLVRQGIYKPGEIAVLTPYMAQFRLLRQKLSTMFEVTMNDRDQADLEAEEGAEASQPINRLTAKAQLSQSIRVATIDNFQGEEAKVVAISLVRSNPEHKVGFLKTSNRINVLLSRAKHGMFILGDATTAATVPMWAQVIGTLEKRGNIGHSIPLMCPRHPDTDILVSEPDHFQRFSPDGGCNLPCDQRLGCGHACTGRCHSDVMHHAVKCLEPCQRLKAGCNHKCPRVCGDPCQSKCQVVVDSLDITLECGHQVATAVCWQAQDPSEISCKFIVTKEAPLCGHQVEVTCSTDVHSPRWRCLAICGASLPCGHTCKKPCWRCRPIENGTILEKNHGTCTQICGRNYTTCHHSCSEKCHADSDCQPCSASCEVHCSHSKCSRPCHEPCAPCAHQICASKCPHGACTMPCAAPCDWVPCSRRCEEVLSCGHRCPSFCGEPCPGERFCQECANEETKGSVVDFILGEEYGTVDLDETPCIFLDCGHFFTGETLDGHMGMSEHFDISGEGIPTAIKTSSQPFSVQKIPACPNCRGSLRNIARYGRIVRRGILDESTKKFIAWATNIYAQIGQRFILVQEKMGKTKLAIHADMQTSQSPMMLDGSRDDQIKAIKKSVLKGHFKGILGVRAQLRRHLDNVAQGEQPFQRVADMVRYANQQKESATQGHFQVEESVIQLRSYIETYSLLLRCELAVITELVKIVGQGDLAGLSVAVNFDQNRRDALKLEELAQKGLIRPYQRVEAFLYCAQFCAFERALLPPEEDAHFWQIGSSIARREALKKLAEDRFLQAREVIQAFPSCSSLLPEIEAAEVAVRDSTFYAPVSMEEKLAVFKAMETEFMSTGHWYTCVNGHYFTIGECGGAMARASCPDCNAPIGGERHQTAEGVRRADDMEELGRGVGDMHI